VQLRLDDLRKFDYACVCCYPQLGRSKAVLICSGILGIVFGLMLFEYCRKCFTHCFNVD